MAGYNGHVDLRVAVGRFEQRGHVPGPAFRDEVFKVRGVVQLAGMGHELVAGDGVDDGVDGASVHHVGPVPTHGRS